MQHQICKNFQPGEHLRSNAGEVFEVVTRETYLCKGCDCKFPYFCDEMKERTTLTIRSQRGEWEMSLKTLNEKYNAGAIQEETKIRTKWK